MNSQKPSSTNSNINSERAMHLDGIRGIAALAVAIFHFFRSFDNSLISSAETVNHTFLSTLWNGHFAVALFFVLSGFLFFEKFYRTTIVAALTAVVKRYFRLCAPILFICLTAYVLHASGLFFNKEAGTANGSDWLVRWYTFPPDIYLAITESLWKDFFYFDPTLTYNSNLWTISNELLAVFLVIAIGLLCRHLNLLSQIILLLCAAALSFGTHYLEFILGSLLALTYLKLKTQLSFLVATLTGLIALSIAPLTLPPPIASLATDLFYPLGAVLFIGSVNANRTLRKIFSNKVFLKLGEMSFGLYLTHFVVLSSAASAVFISTDSVTQTFIAYLAVTAVASIIFTYAVDKPWMKFLNGAFGKKKISSTTAIPFQ